MSINVDTSNDPNIIYNVPETSFYYGQEFLDDDNDFFITQYALDMAIETKFANMLFHGDMSRIIYASNDWCFTERSRRNKGLLEFPFMNYYLASKSLSTRRMLFNNQANVGGIDLGMAEILGGKFRVSPVHYN
jgi:hypothetical protein